MAHLRIIGGTASGRLIQVPGRGTDIRPTSDRVREALFSILGSVLGDLSDTRVLDLYAGSGALGLEALSRGASAAVLVDRDRACQRVIRANIETLGFGERCRLIPADVAVAVTAMEREGRAFDLLLADPPYAMDPDPLLRRLASGPLVEPDVLLVLEHSTTVAPVEEPGRLRLAQRRRYGDTSLSLYRGRDLGPET